MVSLFTFGSVTGVGSFDLDSGTMKLSVWPVTTSLKLSSRLLFRVDVVIGRSSVKAPEAGKMRLCTRWNGVSGHWYFLCYSKDVTVCGQCKNEE